MARTPRPSSPDRALPRVTAYDAPFTGIKCSVGVSEAEAERARLEQVRRSARAAADEPASERRLPAWPLRTSADDEAEALRAVWAW